MIVIYSIGKYLTGKSALIFFLLFTSLNLFSQDIPCWNIFRGDQALTGATKFSLPDNPTLLWTYKTDEEIKSSPVFCDNKIVFGSTDGNIYCLNAEGKFLWKFQTGNAIEASALIIDGAVYAGNLDGTLYSIDLASGRQKWLYHTDNQISGSPNWWKNGSKTNILVGSYDYFLHCVDASSGKLIWKYESDNFINGAAACKDGIAVFGGCDGFLHMINISTGTLKDKIEVATYVAGSAALSGKYAFIGDYDGKFSCVNLDEKKITWVWKNEEVTLPFLASPALFKDRIIIGNQDKYVYCFSQQTGELIWKFNTGARVDASALTGQGKILLVNTRGDIFILNGENGKNIWSYELGTNVYGNPAVTRDRFFICSGDGCLYCFGFQK